MADLVGYGADAIGAIVQQCCDLAQRLAERVDAAQELERLAPVALNIICYRAPGTGQDMLNAAMVADLQEDGVAAPSTKVPDGRQAIRAAIVNHRT